MNVQINDIRLEEKLLLNTKRIYYFEISLKLHALPSSRYIRSFSFQVKRPFNLFLSGMLNRYTSLITSILRPEHSIWSNIHFNMSFIEFCLHLAYSFIRRVLNSWTVYFARGLALYPFFESLIHFMSDSGGDGPLFRSSPFYKFFRFFLLSESLEELLYVCFVLGHLSNRRFDVLSSFIISFLANR